MSDIATAIERYNEAACEAERILLGRLLQHAIPVVANGALCYAATTRGVGVTRLRRAG